MSLQVNIMTDLNPSVSTNPHSNMMGAFEILEDFGIEAFSILEGDLCNISREEYDLDNPQEIYKAAEEKGKAEDYLNQLHLKYRRKLVELLDFSRRVESLFGIFYATEFLPTLDNKKTIPSKMQLLMANEAFVMKYEFDRNRIATAIDVYEQLGETIKSRFRALTNVYWDLQERRRIYELMYNTHNTGIPRLTPDSPPKPNKQPEHDRHRDQTPMPRVRMDPVPKPASAPPPLPPEFLR